MTRGRVSAVLALVAACAWACGGDSAPPSGAPAPSAGVVAEAGGRIVVATVDGRPIYDDCVAAQARALALTARQALEQCIDFELLAARAESDGLAAHADVVAAGKRESVRALLAREFEPGFDGPEDVETAHLEKVWKRPAVFYRYNHPEYRLSYFVRVKLPENEPRGTEADRKAEAVAQTIYRALDGLKLERDEFRSLARKAAGGVTLVYNENAYPASRDRTDPGYADALFNIETVNTVSPPAKTRWGWDVILLTGINPAQSHSFEQAEPSLRKQVFPSARERAFESWLAALKNKRAIEVYDGRLPAGGAMAGLGPGPGSPASPAAPIAAPAPAAPGAP